MKRRILSLLLAFVMVLGMFPTVALAEETAADYKSSYGITVLAGGVEMDLVADGTEACGVLEAQKLNVTVPAGTTEITFVNITDTVLYGQMYVYNGNHTWEEFASNVTSATISLEKCGTSFCVSDSANAWYHVNVTVEEGSAGHIHSYEEVVTAPTCTEGGYTTFTCACGDSYVAARTDATGHNYVDGVCTVCGAECTVIPEGASFIDMMTSDDKPVIITKMDDHYKVEVPLGTVQVNVTYPKDVVTDNGFGFALTKMIGFDGVGEDGYGKSELEDKTIVGLTMEKAPANMAPTMLDLLNVPYGENPRMVGICKNDETIDYFAFTYILEEGQHFAALPEGIGYTVSGSPVASDGYTFNVALLEGYEATADFAIKVNGETVATVPGDVTVASVTEDLIITVAGVQKIVESTDISVTFDLTDYSGEFSGYLGYTDTSYANVETTVEVGKKNTLTLEASKNMIFQAQASKVSALVTGWKVNDTVYDIPTEYTTITLADNVTLNLNTDGYFALNIRTTEPFAAVIKPILAEAESLGAAPAFNEDCIKVTDISVVDADVESYEWEGDTLNVILAEGTEVDATIKTLWTFYAKNTFEGATRSIFNYSVNDTNGSISVKPAEGTAQKAWSTTLADGIATVELSVTPSGTEASKTKIIFTPKTFTVNFTVAEAGCAHEWTDATCTAPKTCSLCGETEGEALGHSYVDGVCTVCGVKEPVSVDVYMTVTKNSGFVTTEMGDVMAMEKVTVPYFDLALYGLECLYYNPDCYKGTVQSAGSEATANGNVTILHLIIYATEIYQCGLTPEKAGQGYLAESGWPHFMVYEQNAGSAFIYFWEFADNVTYYLNYEYPLGKVGWGATCDQILLEDGDVVSFRYDTGSGNRGTYYHFGDTGITEKDLLMGNALNVTLFECTRTADYSGTGHEVAGAGHTVSVYEYIGGTALVTGTTDAYGDVRLDTSSLAVGTYYVTSNTFDPAVMLLNVTSNVHTHNYTAVVTEPTCTEGGYTTYTCSCGDSYVGARTEPKGHSYDNGVCSVCGEGKTVVPEGANFINIVTNDDRAVKITSYQWNVYGTDYPYYHLELPEGATGIKITYPAETILLDQFGYAFVTEASFDLSETRNNSFPYVINDDGTVTVTFGVAEYLVKVPFSGKGLFFYDNSFSFLEAFTVAYDLPEGYYNVVKPESERYTVTGEDTATDGYTFTVEIAEGYEPGENFAIKVNGETVATEPGAVTLDTVNDHVIITVEGVLLTPSEPDLFVTIDLTGVTGDVVTADYVCVEGPDIPWTFNDEPGIPSGESTTLSYAVCDYSNIEFAFKFDNTKVTGWEVIDGEGNSNVCEISAGASYRIDDDFYLMYANETYMYFNFGWTSGDYAYPGEWTIKPILAPCEHVWTDATCTEPKTCSVCGETEGEALGHDYVDGVCTRCGETDPDYEEPKPAVSGVIRVAGADRIETSLKLADQLKEALGVEKFEAVVVASGLNFPDALTGSYLAAVKNAPILLTAAGWEDKVNTYITENLADGGTVYVLGGTAVVPEALVEGMTGVKRLAGDDRFGTNLAILEEAGVNETQEILICTATGFADSLAASASGLPILLVHGSLTAEQKTFLEGTSKDFVIIGGEAAVSADLAAELDAIGDVERVGGENRYKTSVLVAQRFVAEPDAVILAYARNYPDGLCGGPLAYALNASLILTDNYDPSAADGYVDGISAGIVVGGPGLISDDSARDIFELASDTPILK